MPEQVTVKTTRGSVEWRFQRPSDFEVVRRSASTLTYPWEIAGAGDWDISGGTAAAQADPSDGEDVPRLEVMPPTGVFVWLLVGDVRRENKVEPGSWSPILPYQYMAPSDGPPNPTIPKQMAPLTSADRSASRWPELSSWARIVLLTEANGTPGNEPLYLMVRAFAGPKRSSIGEVNSLVSSLTYRYVT